MGGPKRYERHCLWNIWCHLRFFAGGTKCFLAGLFSLKSCWQRVCQWVLPLYRACGCRDIRGVAAELLVQTMPHC